MRSLYFYSILIFIVGCKRDSFNLEWTNEKAPETFKVRVETTRGNFEIEAIRKCSPKAADRFYQLVKHNYYDDAIFYRVVPGFVAQFGNTDTIAMNKWRLAKIPDEEVICPNSRAAVSFARSGKETRDLELFINLKDNPVLDTLDFEGVRGFPAFGKVTKGMDVVDKLYAGYGEDTMRDENLYLNRKGFEQLFPELDLIKRMYLIE